MLSSSLQNNKILSCSANEIKYIKNREKKIFQLTACHYNNNTKSIPQMNQNFQKPFAPKVSCSLSVKIGNCSDFICITRWAGGKQKIPNSLESCLILTAVQI